MRDAPPTLINFDHLEALPAALAAGRGNAVARALAGADWLLRRKSDGRWLAVVAGARVRALRPGALRAARGRMDEARLVECLARPLRPGVPRTLPLAPLRALLAGLGVDADYGRTRGLALVPEPARLAFAGFDRYRRPLWLTAAAARGWSAMRAAARDEGVALDAISGYRSHAYQLGIFRRKLARGQALEDILRVNAAPGYSEHHGGGALDIGTPGEPPAEESFEATPAFAWLVAHAARFGFTMSYPRGNPHGIVYEPWHWCLKR
ncbi:MAG: M15 family metallopeptidase [Lysobacteraceae bacterium]